MADEKRARRTKEEIIEALDKKITSHQEAISQAEAAFQSKAEYHKAAIEKLEAKKENTLNPKARAPRTTANSLIKLAKEKGLTLEDIAEKLGIEQ